MVHWQVYYFEHVKVFIMLNFKDNFSKHAEVYARFRPDYPIALFEFLQSITKQFDFAWDCGTGNGQCALQLANYFNAVYATDPSEDQIKNAVQHPKILYKVEKAEKPDLKDGSVDLITVATALHWFNFEEFYAEAKRVLKCDGIIAAWAYGIPSVSPEIDRVTNHFHYEILEDYWQPENRLIDKKYATIPFPFPQIETPLFKIEKQVSLNELIGHFSSWSAVQRFINVNHKNPLIELEEQLLEVWGKMPTKKKVTWELYLKIGLNTKPK